MSAISSELLAAPGGRQFATAPTDILLKKWNGDRMPKGDPTTSKESPRCGVGGTLICLALLDVKAETPSIAILVADLAIVDGSTDSA